MKKLLPAVARAFRPAPWRNLHIMMNAVKTTVAEVLMMSAVGASGAAAQLEDKISSVGQCSRDRAPPVTAEIHAI